MATAESRSFLDTLYELRESGWAWLTAILMAIGMAVDTYTLIRALHPEALSGTGPWTLILVVGGSPLAFFLWAARDRAKKLELQIERRRVEQLDEAQAERVFEQLQEWAAGANDVLQAAAIYQLKPYMLGESGGPIPVHLSGASCPYIIPARTMIRALLDDRRWESRWEESLTLLAGAASDSDHLPEPPSEDARSLHSPVKRAIEAVLLSSRSTWAESSAPDYIPWDLSRWNLSGLDLRSASWPGMVAAGARFNNAMLFQADVSFANMTTAKLSGADLMDAKLTGARLEHADLSGALLIGADARGAVLSDASLVGANLEGVNLTNADLSGANLRDANLLDATVSGAKWCDANLEGVHRPENDIAGWHADERCLLRRIGTKPQP